MKDLLIRSVKGAYGLLPESTKNKLRRHHHLREWYGSKLRKSSIAYEVPSQKKTRQLHRVHLAHQQTKFERAKLPENINIVILGEGDVSATLASIEGISKLCNAVYCELADETLCEQSNLDVLNLNKVAEILGQRAVLFVQAGNEVIHAALTHALLNLNESDAWYFDSYVDNSAGVLEKYELLPDWSPELLLSTGYVKRALLVAPHAIQLAESLVECNDVALGLIGEYLRTPTLLLNRIPLSAIFAKQPQQKAQVKSYFHRTEHLFKAYKFDVEAKGKDVVSVRWPLPTSPLVSLVIPTFNGLSLVKACIESILEKTTYKNYEILLVDNNSNDPECLAYFDELDRHPKVRLLKYPHPFNYSAINNFAVKQANGEVVGLVNNDIEVISPQWLEYMAGHAMRGDIGCVGAKLLYSDDRIQHAGVVLGYGGGAGHAHKYFPRYHPGYMNRLIATQNYSAVTAACLLVKKSKYEEVGGLNEKDLHVAFNDVDFCLKVLETGVRNVYCAEAELYHHESVSRGLDISEEKAARFNRELTYLRTKWKKYIDHDPAYNPNLTLKRENFAIKGKEEY
ncbi:glycosyltransferase [Salinimonas sp. HHU 13199]|uniref:Glycosyltransferase n=1 Tax=Salinimonas profundi TaxID=2729140 RepID=A0ABR8LP15_9ALTE|nr:glycosyltransferase family 2 protein [Salinimonas profundi]MBD3587128.1 glycosyltransferase [Salinimonas profundi]